MMACKIMVEGNCAEPRAIQDHSQVMVRLSLLQTHSNPISETQMLTTADKSLSACQCPSVGWLVGRSASNIYGIPYIYLSILYVSISQGEKYLTCNIFHINFRQ